MPQPAGPGVGRDEPRLGFDAQPVRISVRGHGTPIWPVPDIASGRSAYRGEAAGVWLWLIGVPADAGYAVLDDLGISDQGRDPVSAVPGSSRSRLLRPGTGG